MRTCLLAVAAFAFAAGAGRVQGVTPVPDEFLARNDWVEKAFGASATARPAWFSFRYQGKESTTLLKSWSRRVAKPARAQSSTRYTEIFQDPETGLEARVEAVQFHDWPAVEWVVHLSNTGTTNTPLLENIRRWTPCCLGSREAKRCCIGTRERWRRLTILPRRN